MIRMRMTRVILAAVCAFIASSLWYSSALFGRQFLQLSGMAAAPSSAVSKVAGEIMRNLILASAIDSLLTRSQLTNFRSFLAFDAILWIGFPVMLLSGSVMWENIAPELALIHAGDWLMKIIIMTMVPWVGTKDGAIKEMPPLPQSEGRRMAVGGGEC